MGSITKKIKTFFTKTASDAHPEPSKEIPKNSRINIPIDEFVHSFVGASGSNPLDTTNRHYSRGWNGEKFPGSLDGHGSYYPIQFSDDISSQIAISRNQARENTISSTAIKTKVTTTIGMGLLLESDPLIEVLKRYDLIPDDFDAQKWGQITGQEWAMWAATKGADYTGKMDFYEMQDIAFRNYLIDGRVLAVIRNTKKSRDQISNISVQLLTTDYLSSLPIPQAQIGGKRVVIQGTVINKQGRVLGYLLNKNIIHSAAFDKPVYMRARGIDGRQWVVDVVNRERPDDIWGIPFLRSVLHDLEKLEKYSMAELQGALLNAMFAAEVFSEGDQPPINPLATKSGDKMKSSEKGNEKTPGVNFSTPGIMLIHSQQKQRLAFLDVKRPNTDFDKFYKAMLNNISASLGISAGVLLKTFDRSYSAARGELIEVWRQIEKERAFFARNFCQPIYTEWLNDMIMTDVIDAPGWKTENAMQKKKNEVAWSQSKWFGPQRGNIDPLKSAKAAQIAQEEGWTTAERNASEMGSGDFYRNAERRKKEAELINQSKKKKVPMKSIEENAENEEK